ncbi:MAG: cytochrome P450, partial [Cyclobacteriaceae bacterium]
FETRLLGEKAVCLHGEEASRLFYDTELFKRDGATPKHIQKSLFGEKGVQTLDDAAHRHRKEAFMSLMSRERLEELQHIHASHWEMFIRKWEKMGKTVIFDETQLLMCRTSCEWAGVPLPETEVARRKDDLMGMIDAFGAIGPRLMRGMLARKRAEKWIMELVEQVRSGEISPRPDTAMYTFAMHRDLNGQLLDKEVAAVEIINVIRPTVAICWYHTYLALALYQYPKYVDWLRQGGDEELEAFVQEVRRYYPFVPFLGARARKPFEWQGYHFKENQLVLLDIYGTNREDKRWGKAEVFWPERFIKREENEYEFIPQGGGDHYKNHRCAGEWVTISIMKVGLDFLVNRLDYELPEQDLGYSLSRMPSGPRSGLIINNIRVRERQAVAEPAK